MMSPFSTVFTAFTGFMVYGATGQFENCTDYIDLGEDSSSHDFTTSGSTSIGSYTCDSGSDATFRIGNCGSGRGNASFTMTAGEELSFIVAWQNGAADVYVDGDFLGSLSGGGSCEEQTFTLPNTGSKASTIDVLVVDPILDCVGDIQMASVCVKGSYIVTTSQPTTTEDTGCVDYIDLGEDMSSHSLITSGLTSIGAYSCDGGTDAALRLGSCFSGRGNVSFTMENGDELAFVVAWQNDETDVYIDGNLLGTLSGGSSCEEQVFDLPNTGAATIDVLLVDQTLGCEGDIQLASVCVRGEVTTTQPTTTTPPGADCEDYFDLGEDMISHSFSTSGLTSIGAYSCNNGNDATLRLGSCFSGKGNTSFEMQNGDELVFVVAWQNDYSNVYVDGNLLGTLSGGGSCQKQIFTLPNTGSSAYIVVEVEDPTLGCEGDIQIASVCVQDGVTTMIPTNESPETTSSIDCIDEMDLGEDMSSRSFLSSGEVSVGAYACDYENNDNFGGDDNTLRIGNCGDGRGNASWTMNNGDELIFTVAWQNSAANVYVDGNLIGSISGAPSSTGHSCTKHRFDLPSTTSSTIDIMVVDPSTGCTGDIQIAHVCVAESIPTTDAPTSAPTEIGTTIATDVDCPECVCDDGVRASSTGNTSSLSSFMQHDWFYPFIGTMIGLLILLLISCICTIIWYKKYKKEQNYRNINVKTGLSSKDEGIGTRSIQLDTDHNHDRTTAMNLAMTSNASQQTPGGDIGRVGLGPGLPSLQQVMSNSVNTSVNNGVGYRDSGNYGTGNLNSTTANSNYNGGIGMMRLPPRPQSVTKGSIVNINGGHRQDNDDDDDEDDDLWGHVGSPQEGIESNHSKATRNIYVTSKF